MIKIRYSLWTTLITLCTWVVLSAGQSASAVTPALLIGPDLNARPINLQAFGSSKVTYFDAERRLQIEPTGDVLQIQFPRVTDAETSSTANSQSSKSDDKAPAKEPAVLELTNGQRFVGAWRGADAAAETILFQNRVLGDFKVSLDNVRSLTLSGLPQFEATPESDEVLLVNGDVIKGFIVALSAKEAEVQPDGSDQAINLPIDRIGSIRLANPQAGPPKGFHLVWFRDGSRLLTSELDIASDKVLIKSRLADTPKSVELKEILRIEVASLAGRLIDLADLPFETVAGGKVFGLPMLPQRVGEQLHLHAPVTVRFKLPARARRIALVAELHHDGESDLRWADFNVNVRVGGEAAARVRLHAKSPVHAINIPIEQDSNGESLELELDPAANGPVLDRLKLRGGMIFIESPNRE